MLHSTILAFAGNADAQFQMGVRYGYGTIVKKDSVASLKWYERAAQQGHDNAQNNLGWAYLSGTGTEKNLDLARLWLEKSAAQGNAYAQSNLAALYSEGIRDYDMHNPKVVDLLTQSVQGGRAYGAIALAEFYRTDPAQKDIEKAFEFYKICAERTGDAYCMAQIRYALESGQGVQADPAEAGKWGIKAAIGGLEKEKWNIVRHIRNCVDGYISTSCLFAANAGNPASMMRLSSAYYHGKVDGAPNKEQHMIWLEKSARAGSLEAQMVLATGYLGAYKDMPQDDPMKAHVWYAVAAHNTEDPKKRAVLLRGSLIALRDIPPEQREEARKMVQEFIRLYHAVPDDYIPVQ